MADLLTRTPLFFGPTPLRRAPAREGGRAQLHHALLRHCMTELSKLLDTQEQVLELQCMARAWKLQLLNRQFYAIRVAAQQLDLLNLAQVAGRAEVLVNLLSSNTIPYEFNHGLVIHETHRWLRKLVLAVLETNSDAACYSMTQTVWAMHAALSPMLCEYEPAEPPESWIAPKTHELGHN